MVDIRENGDSRGPRRWRRVRGVAKPVAAVFARGNRDLVEYHDGSSVRYRHDAAGNIARVDATEADGSMRAHVVVESNHLHVEYDP